MKQSNYGCVIQDTIADLEKCVNLRLEKGQLLQGGVSLTLGGLYMQSYYTPAPASQEPTELELLRDEREKLTLELEIKQLKTHFGTTKSSK